MKVSKFIWSQNSWWAGLKSSKISTSSWSSEGEVRRSILVFPVMLPSSFLSWMTTIFELRLSRRASGGLKDERALMILLSGVGGSASDIVTAPFTASSPSSSSLWSLQLFSLLRSAWVNFALVRSDFLLLMRSSRLNCSKAVVYMRDMAAAISWAFPSLTHAATWTLRDTYHERKVMTKWEQ